jgi:hypothetical protein
MHEARQELIGFVLLIQTMIVARNSRDAPAHELEVVLVIIKHAFFLARRNPYVDRLPDSSIIELFRAHML